MKPRLALHEVAVELCTQRKLEFVKDLSSGNFKCAFEIEAEGARQALKIQVVPPQDQRLSREVAALKSCDHLNIAKLIDAFAFDFNGTGYWIVIEELLGGGTLEDVLSQRILHAQEVKAMGHALVSALAHLNERRIVHRDVKPANILFRQGSPDPVLTDFGIVRMLDAPTITADFLGMGPGTPAYAAPEQLNNEKQLIDWRTDQFGLGVVLAQCLLGEHPFTAPGLTIHHAIHDVRAKKRIPDETRHALVVAGLGCIAKMLEPWPIGRFRHPQELLEQLA